VNISLVSAKIRITVLIMTLGLVYGVSPLIANAQTVRTYQKGSRLYLDNGTVSVGLETAWGGAIVEVVWHGMNFVNAFDTGREVQVAFYDGDPSPLCGDCAGGKGWDPVQGGDWHKHGSPIVAQTVGSDNIYIKSQPHHWYPDNKGAGPNMPVPGDVFIEQWVSLLPNYPTGIKVHYKVTHFGTDRHTNSYQEFPAVYTNSEFNRFVYYGGTEPWTNAEVNNLALPSPPNPSPTFYSPEQWEALVNNQNVGLTVYVPGQYPYATGNSRPSTGSANSGTNYFLPRTTFSFGPGSVLEADIYLFGGDYKTARQAIYALRKAPAPDPFTPDGYADLPQKDAVLKGSAQVSGWAFDSTQVSEVDVLVDEQLAGRADYGSPRPDVAHKWPHAPTSLGFRYALDTTKYPNGNHSIGVNVKNAGGNVAIFRRIPIRIENSSPEVKPH
jgi:Bacterial Ig domain